LRGESRLFARDARAGAGEGGQLPQGSPTRAAWLQRLRHQVSAKREFDAAAALAPQDPEAQVAAAVGRFDKANPSLTFSRLGPLAKRYPKSQSVRFHLGLCLLWLGSVNDAKQQLRLAQTLGPRTPLGSEAGQFLAKLGGIKTR
jgi:Flp pilus assembly protein TadD